MRGINDRFISDLTGGELSFFLRQVQNRRKELSLEIRGNYINIYYRGGNLLKITQKRNGYSFQFDSRYCLNKENDLHYEQIAGLDSSSSDDYIDVFDLLISEMEEWFSAHPKPEREYQHQLLTHNPAVIDIEYQVKNLMRLDMLLVTDGRLIVTENKYGLGAVSGSAGLAKHYRDIYRVLTDRGLKDELYASVRNIAECKYSLGLLNEPISLSDQEKPEILFLLADYNPRSRSAYNEFREIDKTVPARLLLMDANEYEIDLSKAVDI